MPVSLDDVEQCPFLLETPRTCSLALACTQAWLHRPLSYYTGPNSSNDALRGLAWLSCFSLLELLILLLSLFSQRRSLVVLPFLYRFEVQEFFCYWTIPRSLNKGYLSPDTPPLFVVQYLCSMLGIFRLNPISVLCVSFSPHARIASCWGRKSPFAASLQHSQSLVILDQILFLVSLS
jgi:hypothetical protein